MSTRRIACCPGSPAGAASYPALLCVCALALLLASGCARQATPLARTVQARELYTSTLRVLTSARAAGRIDDDQARRIEAVRTLAAAALNEMERAALSREQARFERAAARLEQAIDPLLEQRLLADREAR